MHKLPIKLILIWLSHNSKHLPKVTEVYKDIPNKKQYYF